MKKVNYNPTSALSILIAAALLYNDQSLDVVIVDRDSDDKLLKSLEESEIRSNSSILDILTNEPDSVRASELSNGILAELHDITDFPTIMKLNAIFNGDKNTIAEVSKAGRSINAFLKSPYSEKNSEPKQEEEGDLKLDFNKKSEDPPVLDPPAVDPPVVTKPAKPEVKKGNKVDADVKK